MHKRARPVDHPHCHVGTVTHESLQQDAELLDELCQKFSGLEPSHLQQDPTQNVSKMQMIVHPCSLTVVWKVFVLPFELTALRGQSRTKKLFFWIIISRIVASPMQPLFCLLIIRFNCPGALSGFFSAWINALMALAPGRRPVNKHPVWAHKKAYSCSHAAFPFPT